MTMDEPFPPLSALAQNLELGTYEHYNGQQYRIVGVARHSETLEELVMYQALFADHSWWVRPVSMYSEQVTIDGQSRPRFRFIHS